MAELSKVATALVSVFEKHTPLDFGRKITVNRLVSEVAAWYEKLRTAMDIRDEALILRGAIERMLKRRLLLGGNGSTVAEPLVRELIWARYFPDASIPETLIQQVSESIDLHLLLREKISQKHVLSEGKLMEWIIDLLSSDIESILSPNFEKDAMTHFMYHVVKDSVTISDDTKQTKDVQVFIGVRRAFAKDDRALLRFHLFHQLFPVLTEASVQEAADLFPDGYKEIEKQISYPRKDRILTYIKRQTPPFLILFDILLKERGDMRELIKDDEAFKRIIFDTCEFRYKGISVKVRTAIIRSFVFILFTKAFFGLFVEGTFERIVYGQVLWGSILINTTIPPFLMVMAGFLIRTPGKDNSEKIAASIKTLLVSEHPSILSPIAIRLHPDTKRPMLQGSFSILWIGTFLLSFGLIVALMLGLNFNLISIAIFLFFLTIISFLTYRIYQTAHTYSMPSKEGLFTPLGDFFLLPIVRVGRNLTEGISQVNIFLFILDFVIETPFKGLFAFFEQWFLFLHAKREELE